MPRRDRWSSPDVIGDDAAARQYPHVEVVPGTGLTHRPSRIRGTVISFREQQRIVLRDEGGSLHEFKPHDGVFLHEGKPVKLIAGRTPAATSLRFTASGSIDLGRQRARVARAGRIWVEGIHDAELVEKIWGDDLRVEGIVVEAIHGANELDRLVAQFAPGPERRLGVLLDHLVARSKESRVAAAVTGPHVLVCGHPYVDIWEAVDPGVLGLDSWPEVAPGQDWKTGVLQLLGRSEAPGLFWRRLLDEVESYRDLATPLVTAVEQLIDFVAGGAAHPQSSRQ